MEILKHIVIYSNTAIFFLNILWYKNFDITHSYSKGWTTWAKRVFSKQNTFLRYRASKSRGSTRVVLQAIPWSDLRIYCYKRTAIHNMHQTKPQMHNDFCIFKFCVYFISYTRPFMKLNLFQNFTLLYIYYSKNFQIYSILNTTYTYI